MFCYELLMSEFNEMDDLDSYIWFNNTYSENIL